MAYHILPGGTARLLSACLCCLLLVSPVRAEEPPLHVVVEGRVEAPLATVRATLLDLESFGRWFPSTEEWSVLSRQEGTALVYGRLVLPWPVDDRDYVARYTWSDTVDGGLEIRAAGGAAGGPEPRAGVVRVDDMRTNWRIGPDGEGTQVRYEYVGSAGGTLPEWVARIGWEMQTGILLESLEREVESRREGLRVARPSPVGEDAPVRKSRPEVAPEDRSASRPPR